MMISLFSGAAVWKRSKKIKVQRHACMILGFSAVSRLASNTLHTMHTLICIFGKDF
jgi:hypothetical protein